MNALTLTTLAFFFQSTPRPLLLHLCDHTLHVVFNTVMSIHFKKDYKERIITCPYWHSSWLCDFLALLTSAKRTVERNGRACSHFSALIPILCKTVSWVIFALHDERFPPTFIPFKIENILLTNLMMKWEAVWMGYEETHFEADLPLLFSYQMCRTRRLEAELSNIVNCKNRRGITQLGDVAKDKC